MIASFLPSLEAGAPAFLLDMAGPITLASYEVALTIVTVIVFGLAAAMNLRKPRGLGIHVMTGITLAMMANTVVHVVGAVLFNGYVPGLVTAVLVMLPFGFLILFKVLQYSLIRAWAWPVLIAMAIVAHYPLLPWLLRLGAGLSGFFDNPTFVPGRSFY